MEIPSLDSIKGVLNQGADLLARGANAITQGATVSAAKVEETARVGKLRLDLLATERRLNRHCTELGRMVYDHYAEGRPLDELLDERDFALHLGQIRELRDDVAATRRAIEETGHSADEPADGEEGEKQGEAKP